MLEDETRVISSKALSGAELDLDLVGRPSPIQRSISKASTTADVEELELEKAPSPPPPTKDSVLAEDTQGEQEERSSSKNESASVHFQSVQAKSAELEKSKPSSPSPLDTLSKISAKHQAPSSEDLISATTQLKLESASSQAEKGESPSASPSEIQQERVSSMVDVDETKSKSTIALESRYFTGTSVAAIRQYEDLSKTESSATISSIIGETQFEASASSMDTQSLSPAPLGGSKAPSPDSALEEDQSKPASPAQSEGRSKTPASLSGEKETKNAPSPAPSDVSIDKDSLSKTPSPEPGKTFSDTDVLEDQIFRTTVHETESSVVMSHSRISPDLIGVSGKKLKSQTPEFLIDDRIELSGKQTPSSIDLEHSKYDEKSELSLEKEPFTRTPSPRIEFQMYDDELDDEGPRESDIIEAALAGRAESDRGSEVETVHVQKRVFVYTEEAESKVAIESVVESKTYSDAETAKASDGEEEDRDDSQLSDAGSSKHDLEERKLSSPSPVCGTPGDGDVRDDDYRKSSRAEPERPDSEAPAQFRRPSGYEISDSETRDDSSSLASIGGMISQKVTGIIGRAKTDDIIDDDGQAGGYSIEIDGGGPNIKVKMIKKESSSSRPLSIPDNERTEQTEEEMIRYPTPPGERDFYEHVGASSGRQSQRSQRGEVLVEEEEDDATSVVVEEPVFGNTVSADFAELVTLSEANTPSEPQSPMDPRTRPNNDSVKTQGSHVRVTETRTFKVLGGIEKRVTTTKTTSESSEDGPPPPYQFSTEYSVQRSTGPGIPDENRAYYSNGHKTEWETFSAENVETDGRTEHGSESEVTVAVTSTTFRGDRDSINRAMESSLVGDGATVTRSILEERLFEGGGVSSEEYQYTIPKYHKDTKAELFESEPDSLGDCMTSSFYDFGADETEEKTYQSGSTLSDGDASRSSTKETISTVSFVSESAGVPGQVFTAAASTGDSSTKKKEFHLEDWGKPMGLPTPPDPPEYGTATSKSPIKSRKPRTQQRGSPAGKLASNKQDEKRGSRTSLDNAKTASPSKTYAKPQSAANKPRAAEAITPVYVDLTYVPHHANPYYCNVEFFQRVRARYYVFSGSNPSKEVFNALLEAKRTWENKDAEVTVIPTYETDTLGYWMAMNQELLAELKIDVAPSASRCTISLQDHETSCAAYRLEF